MTTYMQTVEIKMPGHTLTFHGIEMRPILPDNWSHLLSPSGWQYVVGHGYIHGFAADGTEKRWWNKPTLKDLVKQGGQGAFINFRPDGSVEANYDNCPFYWGPPIAGVVETHDPLLKAFEGLTMADPCICCYRHD